MKNGGKFLEFCIGGGAYVGLELLWRGWSHGSMFLAGGTCLVLIGTMEERGIPKGIPLRVLTGAATITAVELATGLLVNRDYRVWDYRGCWGNVLGQICPGYSLLWIPVSGAAMGLHALVKRLFRGNHFLLAHRGDVFKPAR